MDTGRTETVKEKRSSSRSTRAGRGEEDKRKKREKSGEDKTHEDKPRRERDKDAEKKKEKEKEKSVDQRKERESDKKRKSDKEAEAKKEKEKRNEKEKRGAKKVESDAERRKGKAEEKKKASIKESPKARESKTSVRSKTGKKDKNDLSTNDEKEKKSRISSRTKISNEKPDLIIEEKSAPAILEEMDDISEEKGLNLSMVVQDETSQHFRDEELEDFDANPEEDFDYADDDFEDYDDDFEDDNEDEIDDEDEEEEEGQVDEERQEKKMDSGVYDLETKQKRGLRIKEMEEVKEAMKRENSSKVRELVVEKQDSAPGVPRAPDSPEQTRKGFINFSAAKVKQKTQIAAGVARTRGEELLSMIRLDVVNFDHLDLPPIRYEAFMKTFGKNNSLQAFSQTGEDNLEVEVQTEHIIEEEKWTQKPPNLTITSDLEDSDLIRENLLGCGGGKQRIKKVEEYEQNTHSLRLVKFITCAGQTLNTIIEEDRARREGAVFEDLPQRDIDFAESISVLKIQEIDELAGRPIDLVEFSPDHPTTLLVVHGARDTSDIRTFITIWNISQPSQPLFLLSSTSLVTSACFQFDKSSLIFGGCEDGQVLLWDLREAGVLHQQVKEAATLADLWRAPTFTNCDTHSSIVTAVKPLPDEGQGATRGKYAAFTVVSVEHQGKLVIWTVLDSQRDFETNLGLAHWGQVRMVATTIIDLATIIHTEIEPGQEVHGYDIGVDPEDSSHLMVASDDGMIIHGSTQPDHRPNPRIFKSEIDTLSACKSISFCPFDESYLIIGSDDGSIRLHNTVNEKPLITWSGTVDNEPIQKVIWSPSRPCVFFLLDTANRIHLWDLGAGDIYPAHTVQFGDTINSFSLSCETGEPGQRQMLAVGLEDGRVEILHLKTEYRAEDDESCEHELDRFLHYVSII